MACLFYLLEGILKSNDMRLFDRSLLRTLFGKIIMRMSDRIIQRPSTYI